MTPDDDRRRALEARDGATDIEVATPAARGLARAVVRPLMKAWLRLSIVDEQHVPATGPVLIASTHGSHADSMALGAGLSRPVYFLGDERLTNWPLLGPWLPRLGMVKVKRGQGDASALAIVRTLLDEDKAVVVYPEGSRSRDGRVYRPRSGLSRVAAATRVPIVPAAVANSWKVWPTRDRPRALGAWGADPVQIRFGPPMDAPDQSPRSRRAFNEALHHELARLAQEPMADEFAPVGGPEDVEQ